MVAAWGITLAATFASALAAFAASGWVTATVAAEPDSGVAHSLKLQCARLRMDDQTGARVLVGHVMSETDVAAAKRFASQEKALADVRVVPWPACEAMVLLGPALDGDDRPRLAVQGGKTRLKIGEPLVIEMTSPSFAALIYAFYLQADGTVVNLLPRTNVLRQQDPPRWRRSFGDGTGGLPKFKVSPPKGQEAVIAVASRVPIPELESLERPGRPYRLQLTPTAGGNENTAFLSVLRRGLSSVGSARDSLGPTITANVLHLEIGD